LDSLDKPYQRLKRALDILVAVVLTIALSWLLILIALLYGISMQGNVFFSQERIGHHEKSFRILKFRTLRNSSEPLEQRRFLLGNILRFTSLDELPQLWNILKGDMSFIGPRPLPVEYLPLYSTEQRHRHRVLPGITGWAQVHGRHKLSWLEKFKYDIYYVNNFSFMLDLTILWKTAILLLSFQKDVSLEEPPFTGNHGA
jgi:lipopolysaccharide/colanic/teichoic acid biosynthesis glycosyltransferase